MIEVMGRGWTMPCASASASDRARGRKARVRGESGEKTKIKAEAVQNDAPIPRMKTKTTVLGTRHSLLY